MKMPCGATGGTCDGGNGEGKGRYEHVCTRFNNADGTPHGGNHVCYACGKSFSA